MPSTDLLEEKIRVILRATCLPTVAVVWGGGQDPPCTEQLVRGARTPGLCPVLSSLPAAASQLLPLREGLQQTKQKRPARRRGWCQTRNDFQVGASTRTRAFPAVTGRRPPRGSSRGSCACDSTMFCGPKTSPENTVSCRTLPGAECRSPGASFPPETPSPAPCLADVCTPREGRGLERRLATAMGQAPSGAVVETAQAALVLGGKEPVAGRKAAQLLSCRRVLSTSTSCVLELDPKRPWEPGASPACEHPLLRLAFKGRLCRSQAT